METKGELLLFCLCGFLAAVSAKSVSSLDSSEDGCILDLKNLPDKYEPLYLQGKRGGMKIILPKTVDRRGLLALRQGEELLISCPGQGNFLKETEKNISRAVCCTATTLAVNGNYLTVDQLACKERPTAQTRVTDRRCANNQGVIVELGFELEGWLKVMEVCHNIARSETYYSHHTIHGASLAGKVIRPGGTRPSFSKGSREFFQGVNPNKAYSQEYQLCLFNNLLGPNSSKIFDKKLKFLARGHLAPDADFVYSPLQFLTYFYVNVAPQWHIINAGNWKKVENNTRSLAIALKEDLDVLTGTDGVLELASDKGVQCKIYLGNLEFPVPEHFWKVVRRSRYNSCIVFVITNNPFVNAPPQLLCKDVCAENGWPLLQDSPHTKGYVYCCEFSDFKNAFPKVPDLPCNKILQLSRKRLRN